MAKGNEIIVSPSPRGVFWEGYVNAALKPGTCVQIDVSEGLGNDGRPDWEAYNTTYDAERRMVAVLLPDHLKGKTATDAYVSGDRCFVYVPAPGEELNMLIANLAGTADDHSFGDFFVINDGDGLLVSATETGGSAAVESEPFQLLEDITDPTADTLAHCIYTGY